MQPGGLTEEKVRLVHRWSTETQAQDATCKIGVIAAWFNSQLSLSFKFVPGLSWNMVMSIPSGIPPSSYPLFPCAKHSHLLCSPPFPISRILGVLWSYALCPAKHLHKPLPTFCHFTLQGWAKCTINIQLGGPSFPLQNSGRHFSFH